MEGWEIFHAAILRLTLPNPLDQRSNKNFGEVYIPVGGFNNLENYESQWGGIISHIILTCLKPPTIYIYIHIHTYIAHPFFLQTHPA